MGRAIDMEKDIGVLKSEIKRLENIIRGMSKSIDEMSEKSTKTTHIDLVDDVKEEEADNGEEKANDEGSSKSSGANNKSSGNAKGKTKKAGSSSKWICSL